MEDRLSRTRLMIGEKALKRLKKAHVLVAGCGAVGSFAIEALARSGIGHLTIVDNDTFSISNMNRQLFALHSTMGQKKVVAALQRLSDIAPDMKVDSFDCLINAESVDKILACQPDFVIDAIDSLNPKVCLIEELVKRKIPFVSSMGAALKTKPELIRLDKMSKSYQCPLAAFIRKRLRRRKIPLDFSVIYSPEKPDNNHLSVPQGKTQSSGRIRNEMGSLATITGMFGLYCAQVALDHFIHQK